MVYRKGLKDGIELAKSMNLQKFPVVNLGSELKHENKTEDKEEKQVDPFLVGFQNILSYDGTPQKEANQ